MYYVHVYMGNFVAAYTCIMHFPVWKKKNEVTAQILKPTDDQKPETFLGPKVHLKLSWKKF